MKLWMILTVFGQIIAVAGPLPYDEKECLSRASVRQATFQRLYDSANPPEFNDRTVTSNTLKFKCIWQADRPQLDVQ